MFAAADDPSALWAAEGLRARGVKPLEWITPQMLAGARRWEHRLDTQGAFFEITLADGRCIHSSAVQGVLNRLMSVPDEMLRSAHPQDREYTSQELTAFFLSWLYALPSPVLNRPTPQGLSGSWRHRPEWIWLAAKAGLPVPPYCQAGSELPAEDDGPVNLLASDTSLRTVFVVEGRVIGESAPGPIVQGCKRLAQLARTELLGVDLAWHPAGSWSFVGASPWSDLQRGGEALLDILAAVLTGRKET
jgi:hypothetical protein